MNPMPLNRREALMLGGAAALAATAAPRLAAAQTAAATTGPFKQPKLPFAESALAPTISAETVGLHYGKHHKAYFDTLNKLVPGTPYES
ncbi:hypothetical protein AB4093_27020, partial [Inquilinus sp. 2KB_12]